MGLSQLRNLLTHILLTHNIHSYKSEEINMNASNDLALALLNVTGFGKKAMKD